jgi:hypothetical protein
MPIVTWHEDALLTMESVGAAEVLAAWKDVMHKHFDTRKIELLMVDYRLSMLQRVTDPFSGRDERTALVPVDGSAAGRTFASQQTSTPTSTSYVGLPPLSATPLLWPAETPTCSSSLRVLNGSAWPPRCSGSCCPAGVVQESISFSPVSWNPPTTSPGTTSTGVPRLIISS